MRALVAGIVVLVGAGAARADAPTAPEVQRAVASHQRSVAHRLAEKLVSAHPNDVTARLYAAITAMDLRLLDDARAQADAGLALDPSSAKLHSVRSGIDAAQGDDAAARRDAEAALAVDPREQPAGRVAQLLDRIARFRPDPAAPTDPAAALATRLVAGMWRRAPSSEIAAMLDPGLADAVPTAFRHGPDVLDQIVDGVYDMALGQLGGVGTHVLAWDVQPGATPDLATVDLVFERRWDEVSAEEYRRAFDAPATRRLMSAPMRAVVEQIDPDDREAYFGRLPGTRELWTSRVDIQVGDVAGRLVVLDATIDGHSVRRELLPAMFDLAKVATGRPDLTAEDVKAAEPPDDPKAAEPPEQRHRSIAFWIGCLLVPMVGGAIVLAWLMRESDGRPRRRPRR